MDKFVDHAVAIQKDSSIGHLTADFRTPVPELAPELKIVCAAPSEDLQFSIATDASRLAGRDFTDSFASFGGPHRHYRFPANYSSKELFWQCVGRVVGQVK